LLIISHQYFLLLLLKEKFPTKQNLFTFPCKKKKKKLQTYL